MTGKPFTLLTTIPLKPECVDEYLALVGEVNDRMRHEPTFVPAECIRLVQLSDAPRRQIEAKLIDDTTKHRRWPGEGELPSAEFMRTPLAKRPVSTVGDEVFSLEADAMGAEAAGRRAGETTRAVLAAAGLTVPAASGKVGE